MTTEDFPPPVKPSDEAVRVALDLGFTGFDGVKKARIIAAALERVRGEAAEDAATVTANEWQESVDSWLAEKDDRIAELEAEVERLTRRVAELEAPNDQITEQTDPKMILMAWRIRGEHITALTAEVAELCRLVREKDLRIAALEYQKEQGDV